MKVPKLTGITIPNRTKDENFLTAIMQVRRYLYGGLTDELILRYLNGSSKRIYFKGIMSFYPLVNDIEQLKQLDGWLLSIIFRTVKLRAKLLVKHGHRVDSFFPFDCSRLELLKNCGSKIVSGKHLLKIPSFILIYQAIQKGLLEGGIESAMNPKSNMYNYN